MLDKVSGHHEEYTFSSMSIIVTFQPSTAALVHGGACGLLSVHIPANRHVGEDKKIVDIQSTKVATIMGCVVVLSKHARTRAYKWIRFVII